jgi:hypothetical protein
LERAGTSRPGLQRTWKSFLTTSEAKICSPTGQHEYPFTAQLPLYRTIYNRYTVVAFPPRFQTDFYAAKLTELGAKHVAKLAFLKDTNPYYDTLNRLSGMDIECIVGFFEVRMFVD